MRYAALIILLIAGCAGESSPTDPDGLVAYTDVYRSQTSGVMNRRAEVISREARWVEVWNEIVANQSPRPAMPAVNFDEKILVMASLGETANSCKLIDLQHVERKSGALIISVVESAPAPPCTCPPIVVQPVHVIAVPRLATDATFNWSMKTLPCGS